MPMCFQFVQNDEPVRLNEMDERICKEFGVPVHPTQFSMQYQVITMTGLAILTKEKEDPITERGFKAYVGANKDVFSDEKEVEKYKKFLCGEYKFTGWYQR